MLPANVELFSEVKAPSLPRISLFLFLLEYWVKRVYMYVCGKSAFVHHPYSLDKWQEKKNEGFWRLLKCSTKIMNQTKSRLCCALIAFLQNDRITFLFLIDAILYEGIITKIRVTSPHKRFV